MPIINQVKAIFPEAFWPKLWLVGGSVRDMLLGQQIQDIDLIAAMQPAQLEATGFRPISPVSGTPIWFRHLTGLGKIEITVIAESADLEQELQRRDFTINAMAMDFDGRLVDPLNGQADLAARQLRVSSDW